MKRTTHQTGWKRGISLLLSAVLTLAMLFSTFLSGGLQVSADQNPGESRENPILIERAEQLELLRGNTARVYYRLAASIDLGAYLKETPEYQENGWAPLPDFKGYLDGAGFAITGLWTDRSEEDNVGLFASIHGGTTEIRVDNLGITVGAKGIRGRNSVGVLAGSLYGWVANCYSLSANEMDENGAKADVYHSAERGGGLVGNLEGGLLRNCYSTCNVSGLDDSGGLVGYMYLDAVVESCHASGTIRNTDNDAGGLIGRINGYLYSTRLSDSYATGDVSGITNVGGLVGNMYRGGSIRCCYATGNVSASSSSHTGGLVGYMEYASVQKCFATGDVSGELFTGGLIGFMTNQTEALDCYAVGDVTGTSNGKGGFIGCQSETDTTLMRCFSAGKVTGQANAGQFAGIINDHKTNLTKDCYYLIPAGEEDKGVNGGRWKSIWGRDITRMTAYDTLEDKKLMYWLNGEEGNAFIKVSGTTHTCCGDIASYPELRSMAEHADPVIRAASKTSVVIQPSDSYFGIYDEEPLVEGDGSIGNPYRIDTAKQLNHIRRHPDQHYVLNADLNLQGIQPSDDLNGAFGRGWEPIEGFSGTLDGGGHTVSGLFINRTTERNGLFGLIDKGTVKNLHVTGEVSGSHYSGLLAGVAAYEGSSVSGCSASGSVRGGSQTGLLVGQAYYTTIDRCFTSGTVSAHPGDSSMYGGLAGSQVGGLIEQCYSTAQVSGTLTVGGLVGRQSDGGRIFDTYAAGSVTGEQYVGGLLGWQYDGVLEGSYSAAAVQGSKSAGILMGHVANAQSSAANQRNYFNKDLTNGTVISGVGMGNAQGVTGLTTAEMLADDALKNPDLMSALGTYLWTKGDRDAEYRYYPAPAYFSNHSSAPIAAASKRSVQVKRVSPQIGSIDTLQPIYGSSPLVLPAVPEITPGTEYIVEQGWKICQNQDMTGAVESYEPTSSLNPGYNGWYLFYEASTDAGDSLVSNRVPIEARAGTQDSFSISGETDMVYGGTSSLSASGGSGSGGITWRFVSPNGEDYLALAPSADGSSCALTALNVPPSHAPVVIEAVKSGGSDYNDASAQVEVHVDQRQLELADMRFEDKIYDGGLVATLQSTGVLAGVVASDIGRVSVDESTIHPYFSNPDVGEAKPILFQGEIELSGERAGNYTLAAPTNATGRILPAATSVVLSAVPNGQQVELTATVTATPPGGGTPNGSIQFRTNGVNEGNPVALTDGSAACTLSLQGAGSYELEAVFLPGNDNYTTSTGTARYDFGKLDPTVSMSADPSGNAVAYGDTVTFTAALPDNATGTVQFRIGAQVSAPLALSQDGSVHYTPSRIPAGSYTVEAVYSGDGNYNGRTGSLTFTVHPKTVTFSGVTAKDKTYDGTTTAELYLNDTLAGVLDGDAVSLVLIGAFADADAGTDKTVSFSGAALTGEDARNYTLDLENSQKTATASILKASPDFTKPEQLHATYGDTLQDVTLPAAVGGSFSWQEDPQATKVGNAGENRHNAVFTPDDTTNYAVVRDIPVIIAVGKATPAIAQLPTASTVWLGDKLSASILGDDGQATHNGAPVPGKFEWTAPATTVASSGRYPVAFTPEDTGNYEGVGTELAVTAIDKTPLVNKINEADLLLSQATVGSGNGEYTAQAVAAFERAIAAARTVANGGAPDAQQDINDAVTALQQAINTFTQSANVVDVTLLLARIKTAQDKIDNSTYGMRNGDYPLTAKESLESAIAAARETANKTNITPQEVTDAIDALQKALNSFNQTQIQVSYTALQDLIARCTTIHGNAVEGEGNGQYQPGSKSVFEGAIREAELVSGNPRATQAEVDNAQAALQAALDLFTSQKIGVNYDGLNALIDQAAEKKDRAVYGEKNGDYPVSSKQALETAIKDAQDVAGNPTATQKQIEDAVAELQKAINAFNDSRIQVDYTPLADLIQTANNAKAAAAQGEGDGQYPKAAMEALEQAIAAAKAVESDTYLSQAAVNAAYTALQKALADFEGSRIQVDRSALEQKIAEAEQLIRDAKSGDQPGEYPQTAIDALQQAIKKAKETAQKSGVSAEEISDAAAALAEAVEAFQDQMNRETVKPEPEDNPPTGGSSHAPLPLAALTVTVGCAGLAARRRRKKARGNHQTPPQSVD